MKRVMHGSHPRAVGLVPLALLLALTVGCVRGCTSSRPPIHINPNMDRQERYEPQSESGFFYDGMTARLPVPGTIAQGEMPGSNEFLTGKNAAGEFLATNPLPVDDALLARGAERYEIYCAPCHDARGTGRGILFEWGSVPTASFHDEQRRGYPDGQVFDVITNGFGLMQGYRWPISAADRWAIVAYVNLLQEQREARQASRTGTP